MAIGNPAQVGAAAGINTAGQTQRTIASVVVPANSLVVTAVFNGFAASDPGVPTSVTDGTNTATVADKSVWIGNAGRISLFSWYDTAGRTATFTINFPASNMTWAYVFTLSSAATSAFLDQTGSSSSSAATSLSIATAGTVAQSDEVAVACYSRGSNIAAPTTYPGAGYTSLNGAAGDTDGTRSCGFMIQYKNGLTGGSTETAGGTLSAGTNIGRVIATYKGAAAAAVTPPRPTIVGQAVNRSYTI